MNVSRWRAVQVGLTTPNPAVGCVIVRGDRVVGRGVTAAGGRPHGETVALARAGVRARGATAYVSFEPCAHQGQTPPCARALIESWGRPGRDWMSRSLSARAGPRNRDAAKGRECTVIGVAEDEAAPQRGLHYASDAWTAVRAFKAGDDDGRPNRGGQRRFALDQFRDSRQLVHQWRKESDVVMVGAGTVIADNPRLTAGSKVGATRCD